MPFSLWTTVDFYFINDNDYDVGWRQSRNNSIFRNKCPDTASVSTSSKSNVRCNCSCKKPTGQVCKAGNTNASGACCNKCKFNYNDCSGNAQTYGYACCVNCGNCTCRGPASTSWTCPAGTIDSGVNNTCGCQDCYSYGSPYNCSDINMTCSSRGLSQSSCSDWLAAGVCYITTCPSGFSLINSNSLCQRTDAACQQNMLVNGLCNPWNERDRNYYAIDFNDCFCTGVCSNGGGVKNLATYDPSAFAAVGGVGPGKLVQSMTLVQEFGVNSKCFKMTVDCTKLVSITDCDQIKTILSSTKNSMTLDPYKRLNTCGYQLLLCYCYVNIQISNFSLDTLIQRVPLIMGINTSSNASKYTQKTATNTDLYGGYTMTPLEYIVSVNNVSVNKTTDNSGLGEYFCTTWTLNSSALNISSLAPMPTSTGSTNLDITLFSPAVFTQAIAGFYPSKYGNYDNPPTLTVPNQKQGLYLAYYNLGDLINNAIIDRATSLYDMFVSDNNADIPVPYRQWNKYVYVNWLLPKLCIALETRAGATHCPPIMNYNGQPVAPVQSNCMLLSSYPDCQKYLMSNPDLDQPAANTTRTDAALNTAMSQFCQTNINVLECQCLNREQMPVYAQYGFANPSSGFPVSSMSSNPGCWYTPCRGSNQDYIYSPSQFWLKNRNCPDVVCQSILAVVNRPENSVTMKNISMVTNCASPSTEPPVAGTDALTNGAAINGATGGISSDLNADNQAPVTGSGDATGTDSSGDQGDDANPAADTSSGDAAGAQTGLSKPVIVAIGVTAGVVCLIVVVSLVASKKSKSSKR